jgi:hypothetical protein
MATRWDDDHEEFGIIITLDSELGYAWIGMIKGRRKIPLSELAKFGSFEAGQYVMLSLSSSVIQNIEVLSPGASNGPGENASLYYLTAGRVLGSARGYEVAEYSYVGDTLVVSLGAYRGTVGRDSVAAPVESAISVNAYLETENGFHAGTVFAALDSLASVLGYEGPYDETVEHGSIIRRAKARLSSGISSEEALMFRSKIERAIELIAIGERQAKVSQVSADVISRVLESLKETPSACVLVGTIFIVKYQDAHGPIVLIRPLSALELSLLERLPGIQRDPRNAIEMLAAAVMSVEAMD